MTDNRTTELLPCPFCGGEVRIVLMGSYFDEYWWQVTRGYNYDTKCHCRVFMESDAKFTLEEGEKVEEYPYALELRKRLVEKWNTRAERTCEKVEHKNLIIGDEFLKQSGWDCSECGGRLDFPFINCSYCPTCGAKVTP